MKCQTSSNTYMEEGRDPFDRRNLAIFPKSRVLRGNSAIWQHRSGFNDGERSSLEPERGEMNEMVVREVTIFSRVLAHGRNPDSILECYISNTERCEENWSSGGGLKGGANWWGLFRCKVRRIWRRGVDRCHDG